MINNFFLENGFDATEQEYLKASRLEQSNVFEFPSEDIQVLTNNLKGESTALSGLAIFKTLRDTLNQHELKRLPKILDYGCGWGRITRLMATLSDDGNIHGVDVDSRLISSANECATTIRFSEIESMGTLPFDTDYLDLAFANSVFSHLSEVSAIATLGELTRVLSPDGLLIISVLEQVEMEKFYSNVKQKDWIEKVLGGQGEAEQGLRQNNFVWGDTKRWDNYGIAIMNDVWLNHTLASFGAELVGAYRTNEAGTQNYKVIKIK
ncbi:class I SAM-dependent methyltransferase [Luminiphilus sp.]|nr:class I SAM-dependent methyltransferase [Luminiphilus sp.]MDA9625385.1 class I SAM-dependent methyltransferase [Luminiphilus sp.]